MARVLLTEGSSLSAREHMTVLGRAGVGVDVIATERVPFARFSRWCGAAHRLPPAARDPRGYLAGVAVLLASGDYDALLATHEQAWLLAAGRHLLPADSPMAIPSIEALSQVQGKVAAARTFAAHDIPQPDWQVLTAAPTGPFPLWLKSDYSTAGRGVRRVRDRAEGERAWSELAPLGQVLAQQPAEGQYGQAAALFDEGRMIGVHCTVSVGQGAGGSAAARLGVDHPSARRGIERLGEGLAWHGGLTLDYVHTNGRPLFIECNPRTVEPGNAARSGVNLPELTMQIIDGTAPRTAAVGRPGIRTQGLAALALGTAEVTRSRSDVARTLLRSLADPRTWIQEMMTPPDDPPSMVPLTAVAALLLRDPDRAARLTDRAVAAYGVTPDAVAELREPGPDSA